MRSTSVFKLIAIPGLTLALGMGLFWPVRALEGLVRGGFVLNAGIEESFKLLLFLLALIGSKLLKDRTAPKMEPLMLPLIGIIGFAIMENVLYFLRFPSSSIYRRLLYAYPIHLNTGLLYTLGFVSGRWLLIGTFFLLAIAFHAGLNALSLESVGITIYLTGLANIALFFFLTWKLKTVLNVRSLKNAGI